MSTSGSSSKSSSPVPAPEGGAPHSAGLPTIPDVALGKAAAVSGTGREAGHGVDRPETAADFQALFGMDLGKAQDVVETLWDGREKVVAAVDWVWEHRDSVTDLLHRLPDLLHQAGEGLGAAGGSAQQAARFLTGDAENPGARHLSEAAADAIEACRREIGDLTETLGHLAERIAGIDFPGIDGFFDEAADRIREGGQRLGGMATGLDTVQDRLRHLGGRLGDAAGDLGTAGGHLHETGATLSGLAAGVSPSRAGRASK